MKKPVDTEEMIEPTDAKGLADAKKPIVICYKHQY